MHEPQDEYSPKCLLIDPRQKTTNTNKTRMPLSLILMSLILLLLLLLLLLCFGTMKFSQRDTSHHLTVLS